MEQTKKFFKIYSIVVLIFAVLTLVQTITELVFNFDVGAVPEGTTEDVILAAKIVLAVIAVLIMIPQVYIGVRGLQLVKKPATTKGHIVWAKILFVLSILGMISPVVDIFRKNNVGGNISTALSILVEVFVYYDYMKYATAYRKDLM